MARFALASNSDWELTHDDQDIRGWEARDGENKYLGHVAQMVVNTETEHVDVIRLDTGRECAVPDVYIGEDIVYCDVKVLSQLPVAAKAHNGDWRIARRLLAPDAAFAGYEPIFRVHYRNALATTGWVYEFYLPGYRFGYQLASKAENAGKTFEQVEPGAREAFIRLHGSDEYSAHREAIRYGYDHHREQLSAA